MPSFESINYSLRPNKNVERKLIVECLLGLNSAFEFSKYVYIGLGSMWFVDFILMHRHLLIRDMISIEKESAGRASFNRPYSVVTVEPGETTKVLPTLPIDGKRTIVWLDYDQGLGSPVLQDTETVCKRVASGSVLLITMNANLSGLQNQRDEHDRRLTPEQVLRRFGHDLIPNPLSTTATTKGGYPIFLGQILFEYLRRTLRKSGRSETFSPIFNYSYRDGAQMITVGGMIANETDRALLEKGLSQLELEYVTKETRFEIDVPHLTFREKVALDQILPSSMAPTQVAVEDLGFALNEKQRDAYHRFYRFYPTFGELNL
jgi:hypothetical protein